MDKHTTYRKEILKKYHEDKGGLIEGYPNPTLPEIREAFKTIFYKDCPDSDKRFLIRFLRLKHEIITDLDFNGINRYKKIRRFLVGETDKPHGNETIEVIAWLVGYRPRPLSKFINNDLTSNNLSQTDSQLPNKIEQILQLLKELNFMAESVKTDAIIDVFDEHMKKALESVIHKWGKEDLQPLITLVLDDRIVEMEKRLKKTILLNKKMGLLGLLFIPTMTIEKLKEEIAMDIYDVISNHFDIEFLIDDKGDLYIEEGHESNNILDDLL